MMKSIEMHSNRPISPTIHVFECDICHAEIRLENVQELLACAVCGKTLCKKCNNHGLCQADFALIPINGQEELKKVDAKYDLVKILDPVRAKKIMLFLAITLLCELFLIGPAWSLVQSHGPGFVAVFLLLPTATILVGIYLYKVTRQQAVIGKLRTAKLLTIAQKYLPPLQSNGVK